MVSALNTNGDLVMGLHVGGDDYLPKPYDLDILITKVVALLRREKLSSRDNVSLCIGVLKLDILSRRAFINGQDFLLKPKEFALLEVLIMNKGKYIGTEELYEKVWGMDTANDIRTVKAHVSHLRRKLDGQSLSN